MQSLETVLDTVLDELEDELADQSDPLLALAGCVGTVLIHWDSLDGRARRELLARVDTTVRTLEMQARLAMAS